MGFKSINSTFEVRIKMPEITQGTFEMFKNAPFIVIKGGE